MRTAGVIHEQRPEVRYGLGLGSLDAGSLSREPLRFLVAVCEAGVCAILLGNSDAELILDLQERFPGQNLLQDQHGIDEALQEVCSLLEGARSTLSLPLAPRGTPFQGKVWRALRSIPAGRTVTYTQLAADLDLPSTAVRAVAGACAANPCAVAVPCHRVVRGDGGLAGYRWGVERKRALLRREAEQASAARPFALVP